MNLYTANGAYSIHQQDAQRAAQEREYRRIAAERAESPVAKPSTSRSRHGFFAGLMFRARTRIAL